MKIKGDLYPPEWYIDHRSDNTTVVYHRTNVEPYEETNEEGNVTSGFEYDEEIMSEEELARRRA